jgi:hypothetical protein
MYPEQHGSRALQYASHAHQVKRHDGRLVCGSDDHIVIVTLLLSWVQLRAHSY